MKPLRIVLSFGLIATTTAVLALPSYLPIFTKQYHPAAGSALAKAGCTVCHVGAAGGALNPYGQEILTAKGKGKPLTPAVLQQVENMQAAGDGVKNIDKIRQGKLPGSKAAPAGRKHVGPSHVNKNKGGTTASAHKPTTTKTSKTTKTSRTSKTHTGTSMTGTPKHRKHISPSGQTGARVRGRD